MNTLQEALPCPFCGKQHTLQVISGQELMGEDQEFWQHSESFGVVCDASSPDGKGGCGAMGGFKPTEEEAIEAWNTRTALAQQELPQKERPDFMAGYDEGMADAKRMAQQGEPTDDQLVKGVKAMRLFVTKNSVADFKLGYMAALAAAPQAQDPIAKLFGTLPVYDTPAPQPAQGVGRTNPGDETGGAVERFGWQTFLGKSPEIVPATNGSFVWYSDYLKLWQSAQPVHQGERAELIRRLYAIANTEANEVADALNEAADMLQSAQPEDGCAPNHMCNGHRVHIPTGECCNKCGATSW